VNGAAADAAVRKVGRPRNFDVVKDTQGGSSVEYIAGRLKRDHPEIAEKIGHMSEVFHDVVKMS
jgi:hypothetical protein